MNHDLFGREIGAPIGATGARADLLPLSQPAHRRTRFAGARPAQTGAAVACLVDVRPAAKRRWTDAELRAAIEKKYLELAHLLDVEESRRKALAPYETAFRAATRRLEDLHAVWGPGPLTDSERKARRLAAYDQRMHAGQARHPFKQAWETAERMVRETRKELAALNAELGE